ncbi:MAG: hypothetical protein Q9207_006273, partial [Kuettlingeria erythrocarpa]
MGIAQFLASFRRKPKTDLEAQKTTGILTHRRTHHPQNNPPLVIKPAPVASLRSRRAQMAPAQYHIPDAKDKSDDAHQEIAGQRYPPDWLPQAGQEHRRTDTPPANLDALGDLGLQGNVRFKDELFLPPSIADPAVVAKDFDSGEKKRLALACGPRGALGERVEYLRSGLGVRSHALPVGMIPGVDPGTREDLGEDCHVWIEHEPDIPPAPIAPRQPKGRRQQRFRQPASACSNNDESRARIPSQQSSITLCGSICSTTHTYKIEEPRFRSECTFLRPLGQGGFGRIELHRHNATTKLIVLKRATVSHEYIDGLPAEIHVLKTIIANRHPCLPTLFHTNTSLAELHIWQDYADGGDLAHLGYYFTARQRRIPEA